MIKRLIFCFLAVWGVLASLAAESFTIGDFQYSIVSEENNEVSLTKAKADEEGSLIIPSIVEYNGDYYSVVNIGSNALSESGATLTVIPPTVRKINYKGLYGISGVLIFKDDTDKSLQRASTLEISCSQFRSESSVYIDAANDGLLSSACASQFSKIYIGRNISVTEIPESDPDDFDPSGAIKVYDVIFGQGNIEEVVLGPKVDDFDRLIGCNLSHSNIARRNDWMIETADELERVPVSFIQRVIVTNKDAIVKVPLYTFGGTVKADGSVVENTVTQLCVPSEMYDTYSGETSDWRFFKYIKKYDVYDLNRYDVDGDGVINSADISSMFAFMMLHIDELESDVFDVNRDGTVNSGDVSHIYHAIINGGNDWWLLLDENKEDLFYDEAGFMYNIISYDEARVMKFPKGAAEVEIPEQVEHDGRRYRVTRIGSYASNDDVVSLVIPASIDSIEHHGLYRSLNLKDLTILGSDDAKPLRVGMNQFREAKVTKPDTTYFVPSDYGACDWNYTNHLENHDHLQLERLYIDRDIIKEAHPLLCHQNFMKTVIVGEHVTDLTCAWGGAAVAAVRMDTLYVYAQNPPKIKLRYYNGSDASWMGETYYPTFFDGTFNYLDPPHIYNERYDWPETAEWHALDVQLFIHKESLNKYKSGLQDNYFKWYRFKNYNFIED